MDGSARRRSLVCGMGINDSDYPVRKRLKGRGNRNMCPFYMVWANMLKRCYSEQSLKADPTYKSCFVAPEWLYFSSFRSWMTMQDWKGKHLDKDLLSPGNKVYSPDKCVFIDPALNLFLTDRARARGRWPIGVKQDKRDGKFVATCSNPFTGKIESLGYHSTPEAAHLAWRAKKHEHACRYADLQTDPRIARALRERYAHAN